MSIWEEESGGRHNRSNGYHPEEVIISTGALLVAPACIDPVCVLTHNDLGMNETQFTDLKQYIEATVSRQLAHVATKDDIERIDLKIDGLRNELKADIKLLDKKLDRVQDGIADILAHITEAQDITLLDHDRRLRKLERRPT